MILRQWEVMVPNMDQSLCIMAYNKSQAFQLAMELCPGINPQTLNILELEEWK